MMFHSPSFEMTALVNDAKTWCVQHPYLVTILSLPILFTIFYQACHPNLVPGKPHVILFSFSGSSYPQPRSSTLSFFNLILARLDWCLFALKRGKTPNQLSKEVLMDYKIDWKSNKHPKNGDLIYSWDRIFEWDEDCMDLVTLEYLRNFGDPNSENVLKQFQQQKQEIQQQAPYQDMMEKVAHHILQTDANDGQDDINTFWKAITQSPPVGSSALPLQWYLEQGLLSKAEVEKIGYGKIDISSIRQQADFDPNNVERFEDRWNEEQKERVKQEELKALQRGRDVFHRYGPNMSIGLLLVGLAGGFASPRIMDVLRSTGYLVPPRNKKQKVQDEEEDALLERLHEYVEKGRNDVQNRLWTGNSANQGTKTNLNIPSSATSDRTYRRLLETMTFTLDLNESIDSLEYPPTQLSSSQKQSLTPQELLKLGGKGWLACCRVRFLHTNVRSRLLAMDKKNVGNKNPEAYSIAKSGLAINQEDLLATLCAFSVAPLWSLQRLGLPPTKQERQDLIGFWRHVGFYMGIEPKLLQRCFRDVQSAERTFCCISSHHFLPFAGLTDSSSIPPPSIPSSFGPSLLNTKSPKDLESSQSIQNLASRFDFDQGPALPLLWSVANRPPGNLTFANLCSIARFLLGPGLANATSLPRTTLKQYWLMRIRLFILAYPVLFGTYYPRRAWAIELRTMWIQLIRRMVVYSSGSKRTSFGTSKDGSHDDTYSPYVLDSDDGKRIGKEYWRLMREMMIVTVFTCTIALGLFAYATYITITSIQ